MKVEVADIRKVAGDGNLKAFADVRIGNSILIKGVSVMQGKKGVFVCMPRKASKDGRWFDVLELEDALKEKIEEYVLAAYDSEEHEEAEAPVKPSGLNDAINAAVSKINVA